LAHQVQLEQRKKWIQEFDAAQSEIRAKRIVEIESPELVGKGYPPPLDPGKVPSEIREAYFGFESSINRIWTQARMNYVYGFFQSCTFLIGALLELLIKQFLLLRRSLSDCESKFPKKRRWLGTLIEFCEDQGLLDQTILNDAYEINELRIMAVHMETEMKETATSPDEHPLAEYEETSELTSEGEQIIVGAQALLEESLILDISDPTKPVWKLVSVYRPQARKAFKLLSKTLWSLRYGQDHA